MEYVSGGTLQDLIKRGGCTNERVLSTIAYSATKGLLFLHDRKCIHRDIKPNNILLSLNGKVKLADFGISKEFDTSSKQFAQTFVGTFMYMSPERVFGEKYCGKSDCWGLGMTLLSLALGRYPIDITSQQNAYWEVYDSMQDEVGGLLGCVGKLQEMGFSEIFIQFLRSCLQRDVTQRKSTRELIQHKFLEKIKLLDEGKDDDFKTISPLVDEANEANSLQHTLMEAKEVELNEISRILLENHGCHFRKDEKYACLAHQLGLPSEMVKQKLRPAKTHVE